MNPITRYSALLLLLLFVRVMVPDALLLTMHQHAHTEHTVSEDAQHAKVEKEHKHCPVEDLFDASFQGCQQPALRVPVLHKASYATLFYSSFSNNLPVLKPNRGPPVV